MEDRKPNLYIFAWPSFLGGADTKLLHLLPLIHEHYTITLIPNYEDLIKEKIWTRYLDKLGIKYCLFEALPNKLTGVGFSLCNSRFFVDRIAHRAKEKGLRIVWSSEMMWHHEGELEAIKEGIVDKVLYVSELQKKYLGKGYAGVPSRMTGNYLNPKSFPFRHRRNETFTIGRLSRPDPVKYPEDFPVFYERLELPDVRFRVMAWDEAMAQKYAWHKFDSRWDLLQPEQEKQAAFLHTLDLFIYPLGHQFRESWGRSTVEAMLTGCIPLVPPGHHLDHLIEHEVSGFFCHDFTEYQGYAQELYHDYERRSKLSRQCRTHAVEKLCNREEHAKLWREVFQP